MRPYLFLYTSSFVSFLQILLVFDGGLNRAFNSKLMSNISGKFVVTAHLVRTMFLSQTFVEATLITQVRLLLLDTLVQKEFKVSFCDKLAALGLLFLHLFLFLFLFLEEEKVSL